MRFLIKISLLLCCYLFLACEDDNCNPNPVEGGDIESIIGKWRVYQESTLFLDGIENSTTSSTYILTLNADGTGSDNSIGAELEERKLGWVFQTESNPERIGIRVHGTDTYLSTFEDYNVVERTDDFMKWEADLVYSDSYRVIRNLNLNKI